MVGVMLGGMAVIALSLVAWAAKARRPVPVPVGRRPGRSRVWIR
ncbi:MAG: hypothetical protein UZ03_NOB001001028 [Nitrospira sp. OLB3]|nr:MAG: hypothetical protein UZ03_NOB001001028 [Nitrospira sp. OLB3]